MSKPIFRCSSLPRLLKCHASQNPVLDENGNVIEINSSSKMADIGTAAHEFYASMVQNDLRSPQDSFELSEHYGVDEEELKMLMCQGIKLWGTIKDRVTPLITEDEMSMEFKAFTLTGHPDIIANMHDDNKTIVVIDWKTGQKETGYIEQLKGYALLTDGYLFPAEKFLMLTIYTRLGVTETLEFTWDEIEQFYSEIVDIIGSNKYDAAESNCEYCQHKITCPARRSLMSAAAIDMSVITGNAAPKEITPATLAALYPQSRMLKKSLKVYEDTLKQTVIDNGGSIKFDGGEMVVTESEKKTVMYDHGILGQYLRDENIYGLDITVSQTKLKKALASEAEKGQGKATIDRCYDELEEAGCVKTTTSKTLSFKKDK